MLRDLITYLNDALTLESLFERQFGLCELITREDRVFAAEWSSGANAYTSVTDFDKYDGTSWWRLIGPIGTDEVESVSKSRPDLERSYPLQFSVCIPRTAIPTDRNNAYAHDALSWAIQKTFKGIEVPIKKSIGAKYVNIEFGQIEHRRSEFQSAELQEVLRAVDDNYVVLMIQITFTVRASKNCIKGFTDDLSRPLNLSATSTDAVITLSWTDTEASETGFQVQRSTALFSGYQTIGEVLANVETFEDTTAVQETTYFYRVRAISSGRFSAFSNIAAGKLTVCVDGEATLNSVKVVDVPSGGSAAITVEQDGADITADSSTDGAGKVIVPAPTIINTANSTQSGITVSHVVDDDGDTQRGRLGDFYTLDWTNPFGNTNRFTDELGGQTYANGIVIDWAFYNQLTNEVIGWCTARFGPNNYGALNTAVRSFSRGGYSGWYIPNAKECMDRANYSTDGGWNYPPLNITVAFWTSSPDPSNSDRNYTAFNARAALSVLDRNSALFTYAIRTFTWNGTALT